MTSSLRLGRTHCAAAVVAAGCLSLPVLAHASPTPLGAQPADAANLVANPNFQNGLTGWTTHVYHADLRGNGASVHDSGYVGQDVPVAKGASYTFSVRADANPGGSVLALAVDSGTGVSYLTQTVTAPTTLTRSFVAVGPTVYIACQATGGASGGWCNNFSLVSAPNEASTGSADTDSAATGSAG